MARVTLIGLSGYARSGKDTAGEALVVNGWTRLSFADKLREFLYALNPSVVVGTTYAVEVAELRKVVDMIGWERAKDEVAEVRGLLQRCGTEAGRALLGDDIWVDATLRDMPEHAVVTDCRFPNEAKAIKDRGGIVVRIERPGFAPTNAHPSETALDDYPFDAVLLNDRTVEDLNWSLRCLLLAFGRAAA